MREKLCFFLDLTSIAGEIICAAGLTTDSNITESDEGLNAEKVLVNEMAKLASKRIVNSWSKLPELAYLRAFSAHTMHLVRIMYKDAI